MMGATPASPPCCLQSDLVEPRLGHAAMPPSLHSLLTDGGLGVVVVLWCSLLLWSSSTDHMGTAPSSWSYGHGRQVLTLLCDRPSSR